MPTPAYFRPRKKLTSLSAITGGMTLAQIRQELDNGARFVVFQYVISAIIVSSRRNSRVIFIRPDEHAGLKSLPYSITTFLFGWWGFPHGIMNTPVTLYRNLRGGKDITAEVRSWIDDKPNQADLQITS